MIAVKKIVICGSLNMDLVSVSPRIPVRGETIMGSRYLQEPGGKGANQAYGAAKLGGHAAMFGRVGNDEFGKEMRENLQHIGCNVDGVQAIDGTSGVALIMVSETGENSIVVVPGANMAYLPTHIHAADFDHAGVALLQLEIPLETTEAAAIAAHQAGAITVLDPAPAPASPLSAELLRAVDVLTPNETEAALLAGSTPGRMAPRDALEIGRSLQQLGPKNVIVTLGDQGAVLIEPNSATLIHTPKITAVDSTAAGDTFNAALAVALCEGLALKEACRFANHAAALSVSRMGAQASVPTRKEVDDFLRASTSAFEAM